MTNLKEYAVVGFLTEEAAQAALDAGIQRFRLKERIYANELSHREDNIVYLHADNYKERNLMEEFLRGCPESQPAGCMCKV